VEYDYVPHNMDLAKLRFDCGEYVIGIIPGTPIYAGESFIMIMKPRPPFSTLYKTKELFYISPTTAPEFIDRLLKLKVFL